MYTLDGFSLNSGFMKMLCTLQKPQQGLLGIARETKEYQGLNTASGKKTQPEKYKFQVDHYNYIPGSFNYHNIYVFQV